MCRYRYLSVVRLNIYLIVAFLLIARGAAQSSSQLQQQSFRVKPQNVEVVLGHDALLRCEVKNQKGQAQWTQDGFAFGFDRSIPGFSRVSVEGDAAEGVHNLRIRNVSLEDDGEFQCQVTPMLSSTAIRASATLKVLVPPSHIEMIGASRKKTVKAGDSVTLECVAKNAKPAPKIFWYKGNERIADSEVTQTDKEKPSSDPNLKNMKSKITFTPSHLDNNLVYRCQTSHPALGSSEELSASLTLDVQYQPGNPEIHGYIEGEIVRAGENRSLVCRSKGGNPQPQVFWYKNDKQIDTAFIMQHGYTTNRYQFIVDSTDNNAKYECHVYNIITARPKKSDITMRVNFSPQSVKITGPDEVNVGDIIALSCSAINSNPPADVSLLINDHPPSGVSSRRVKTPDGGFTTTANVSGYEIGPTDSDLTVNCYAANQVLATTKVDTKVITVLRPPSPPIILGYTEGTILRKGDRRRLTCRSSGGNPLPDLKWYKGSKLLASETIKERGSSVSHLNIQLQMSDNGAEYRCEAKNSATDTPLFNSTVLTVTYPPTGVKVEVIPSKPKAGEEAILSCITTPAFPKANVSWWRDGFQEQGYYLEESNGLYGGTITSYSMNISVTAEMDSEIFTCQADNGFGSTTHDAIILSVHYKPIIELTKDSVHVKEGGNVVVEASAKGNPAPGEFLWKFGGEQVETGPVLNISDVRKERAGLYVLEVSNEVGTSRKNVTVLVKFAPVITEVTHQKGVNPGSRVSLECHYDGGPKAEVEWKRKDHDLSKTETMAYEGKSVLYITNVTTSDTGFYECHVKNDVGTTIMPNASIVVNQKPVADESPLFTKAAAELGGTAELKCRVRASPQVYFTWLTRDQEPIDSDVHTRYEVQQEKLVDDLYTYESVLLVRNVTIRDHGFFICQARNSLGFINTHVHLEGTNRPDSPVELKILNVTHDSVLLSWIVGFDGGLPQKFRVRYRLLDSNHYLYMDVYPENSTQFWVSNLGLGKLYDFSLVAINRKGESDYTDSVRGETLSESPIEGPIPSDPPTEGGRIPSLVIVIITLVGAAMLVLNVALIACFIRRKARKRMAASSDKASSKSTTIEMYAPSSYTGTVTGETLSSISEKSRESYTNEDSADDYDVDAARVTAASTYLIESLEPPPEYASRPPSHLIHHTGPLNEIGRQFDENARRNMYNTTLDRVPGYGTLGRRGISSSNSDHFNVGGHDHYTMTTPRFKSYMPGSSSQSHSTQGPAQIQYNGSLQRNSAHKLHFPSDYIRNGSVTGGVTPTDNYDGVPRMSPTRTTLSTFGTEHQNVGIGHLPLEQRGHLV